MKIKKGDYILAIDPYYEYDIGGVLYIFDKWINSPNNKTRTGMVVFSGKVIAFNKDVWKDFYKHYGYKDVITWNLRELRKVSKKEAKEFIDKIMVDNL